MPARQLLDITAIAEQLGVNIRHVRRLVAERRIPYLKWGHLLRFDPDEIDTWLDEARVSPPSCTFPSYRETLPVRASRPRS